MALSKAEFSTICNLFWDWKELSRLTHFSAKMEDGQHQLIAHLHATEEDIGKQTVVSEGWLDYTEKAKALNELLDLKEPEDDA